jgi:putative heme-binding domain-containing protein
MTRILGIACCCVLLLGASVPAADTSEDAEKTALAMEALGRLQGVDLEQNARLKEAVLRVLEKTRGTPNFVKLVQQFKLKGQESGLLEVAAKNSANETGVEAMRLILAGKDGGMLQAALTSTNTSSAVKIAEAIGNAGEKEAVMRLLLPLVPEAKNNLALRKQSVRSLAQSAEGAGAILKLAREDKLPDDLKFTASSELNRVRWPELKQEAAKLLPLPQGQNAQPLPPLAELAKLNGNPVNGAKVFSSATVGCNNCHQIKGQGIDFGPNLSEIGSKLGKDALFEAILDPSAGISFGFEAWQLELKSGDEAYGLIASDTAEEIAIKAVGGIVTRYKKAEVTKREQMKLSIMPAGLQQNMTTQELVDLVEYLASLKKGS